MSEQQHMEQSKVMIGDKCAEIYTYESPDLVYAMNWSVRPSLFSDVVPCYTDLTTGTLGAAEPTG